MRNLSSLPREHQASDLERTSSEPTDQMGAREVRVRFALQKCRKHACVRDVRIAPAPWANAASLPSVYQDVLSITHGHAS